MAVINVEPDLFQTFVDESLRRLGAMPDDRAFLDRRQTDLPEFGPLAERGIVVSMFAQLLPVTDQRLYPGRYDLRPGEDNHADCKCCAGHREC
jgi:hypothetical protein